MNALYITIPVSLLLVLVFVGAFIFAVKHDQFEDLVTPAHRMLIDDDDYAATPPDPSQRKDDVDVS